MHIVFNEELRLYKRAEKHSFIDELYWHKRPFGEFLVGQYGSIECVPGTTKNIPHFMANQLLHLRTGWGEVFTRIKLFGLVCKKFPNGGGHGQPKIGINI